MDAACLYAREGWPVLPLRARAKTPLTRHGVKDATTEAGQIQSWWRTHPQANIGLAIPSGFIVLDLDSPDALQRLRAEDFSLPSTVCAATGRGQHLWYATGDTEVSNRVGLLPGVDVRAPGGYVVVPPSIHPSGAVYRWTVDLDASSITDCPPWLLERLTAPAPPRHRSHEDWYRRIASTVPQGQRNAALAEVAGFFFRHLPARVAAEAAYCWARVKLEPPLPDQEVRRTLESIAGRELQRRQGAA